MKKHLLILTGLFCVITIHAQIIHVPADQPTIQAGINAATTGDTVLVEDGTYLENINFMGQRITVSSHFIMDGDTNHINNTIIDGSQPEDPDFASVVTFLTGEDTTSILCGFTITGGTGMYLSTDDARIGGGVACYYATAKIIHNKIINNELSDTDNAWGAGIASINETGDYWTVVTDNIICDNQAFAGSGDATGGGIEIWCNSRICNNLIEDNHCYSESGGCGGGGVVSVSLNNPTDTVYIVNNVVQNNTLLSNSSYTAGGGLYILGSYAVIVNNIFENNQCEGFNYAHGGGLEVQYGVAILTSNTIRDNQLSSNEVSLGGGVSLWYSNSYLADNDISHNSIFGYEADGGGVHFYYPETIEFEGNLISYNQCFTDDIYWGAGVVCIFPTAKVVFRNNEFANNSGPVAPVGAGGGLSIVDAFENEVIVDANRFFNNTAYHGGGFLERSCYNLLVTNNLFSENSTYRGGAIGMYHPATRAVESLSTRDDYRPQVINNTFVSNSASNHAGAIRLNCAVNIPIIFNCIFYENSAPLGNDIYYIGSEDPITIAYSDLDQDNIYGPWTGEENIFEDPVFMDPEAGNFSLDSCNSPCSGTGTDSLFVSDYGWCYCPAYDINNTPRPRPADLPPDMGAYEVGFCVGIGEPHFQISSFNLQIYPNPSCGISDIGYLISDIRYVALGVYDIHGQKIRTLVDEEQRAGEYVVQFDGSDLPAGIYFIRLQVGDHISSAKLILM